MVTKSNQERSKDISQLIRNWINEREKTGDFFEWIQTTGPTAFKGVKREPLAKALGVSKTSLNENEASIELRNAEFRWCRAFSQQQETSKSATAELKRAKDGEKRSKKIASALDYDNTALKAENRLLRARLAKWEAIEQVMLETARAPRYVPEDQ